MMQKISEDNMNQILKAFNIFVLNGEIKLMK